MKLSLRTFLLSLLVPALHAQSILFTVGTPIPDGDSSGLANLQTVTGASGAIQSLTVGLHISGVGDGAFNGDLYATLQHGSAFAVLLNRPGRTDTDPFGYSDDGVNVTINDQGGQPDIHTYRLGGTPSGPLAGTWSSDGRTVDPDLVTAASPRTTSLAAFAGLDPTGPWILFVADLGSGGTARLDSWELRITTTAIPEPGQAGLATVAGLGIYGWLRRRRLA